MKPAATLSYLFTIAISLCFSSHAQLTRENNTTLHFPNSAASAGQYQLAELMPGIQFASPVFVATPPGETRLFVVERYGRIWVINDIANPLKQLFLDISSQVNASDWINNRRTEGLSSIAFHPNFATNHRFFVTYNTITTTADGTGQHNRVSEFRATDDNQGVVADSEIPLITQYDEGDGHNINEVQFGPDGYLYIATGDEGDGGTGDDFNNAQKIDKDFFSAIMRIDVDKKPSNLTPNAHPACNQQTYKIPADNPFVGATSFNGIAVDPQKVRTEFYAVGLRNPWRFSFDPLTHEIYEGDVGQHTSEEINHIVKGGNYGWSFKEGTVPGPKAGLAPAGFTSIAPIVAYGTGYGADQGFSVTCGVVYRGTTLPGLAGNLIFADYESGNLWAINIDTQPYQKPVRLLGMQRIVGFGYDPRNQDILAVNHADGKIYRLQYSTGVPDNVPATLDQTGIFADLATLRVNAGIYPYDVNVPLWVDDAQKLRWFSIPDGRQIHFDAETNWTFPTGSIWIKHFDLDGKLGDPSTAIRLETRVLYKTDSGVYGLSYRWNDAGDNATLVPEAGDARGLYITNSTSIRRQAWHFPSRAECLACHTAAAGRVLGFTTAQMNRDYGYGSITTNQITALAGAGFFDNAPINVHGLRALAPIDDNTVSRAYRVRSYLAANCGQCHQPDANIYAAWDARIATPITKASIIWGPLLNSSGPDDKVVTPGSTNTSAIIKRMGVTGTQRMPPIGTSILDSQALKLISDWIALDLPSFETYEAWCAHYFGSNVPARDADADNDGISNYTEYLMGSDPLHSEAAQSSIARSANGDATITYRHPANRGIFFEATDDLPPNGWAPVNDPQNKLLFPADTLTRTITDAPDGVHKYYRMRVIEP